MSALLHRTRHALVFGLVYFGLCWLNAQLRLTVPEVGPVFLMAGWGMVGVLVLGTPAWVAMGVASLAWAGAHPWALPAAASTLDPSTLAIHALAAMAHAWAGSALVKQLTGRHWRSLTQPQDIAAVLLAAGPLAALASAGLTAVLHSPTSAHVSATQAVFWWGSDALAGVIGTPVALALWLRTSPQWTHRIERLLITTVLCLSLVGLGAYGLFRWESSDQQRDVQVTLEQAKTGLTATLAANTELVHSLARWAEVNPNDSLPRFADMAHRVLAHHPELQALSLNFAVAHSQRPAFERLMQRELAAPGYRITQKIEGVFAPSAPHAQYVAVGPIAPWGPNRVAQGLDVSQEAQRAHAMAQAVALQRPQLSAPLTLAQSVSPSATPAAPAWGALLFVPFDITASNPLVGVAHQGFAVGVIRLTDALTNSLAAVDAASLALRITDITDGAPPAAQTLFQSPTWSDDRASPQSLTLPMAGRLWRIDAQLTPAFLSSHGHMGTMLVGMAGLLLVSLIQYMLLVVTGRTLQAEAAVQAQTTQLASTEEALHTAQRDNDQIYQDLLKIYDQARVGLVVMEDGHLLWINHGVHTLLGWARAALIEQPAQHLFADDEDWQAFAQGIPDGLRHAPSLHKELAMRHQDGSVRWAAVTVSALNAQGPQRLVLVFVDVTESHQLRLRLEDEHRQLQSILDSSPVGVRIVGRHSNEAIYANPAFARMTQTEGMDLLNIPRQDFYVDKRRFKALQAEVRKGTPIQNQLVEMCPPHLPDAPSIWCDVSYYPIPYMSEPAILSWFFDVTDLMHAKQRAEAADVAKTRFLSNMSHEMRTPLNGLLGYARLLGQGPLSSTQSDQLAKMQMAGNHLLALINDVLDFSKLNDGEFQLNPAPMALAPLVQDVLAMLAPNAQHKGLTLQALPIPPGANGPWLGDAQRIRQMLINLVGNAIKFTAEGSVTVSAQMSEGPSPRLCLDVTDTGIGIAAHDINRLFKRFSQVEDSATRTNQGTGLGLSIVKGLAECMNGQVSVSSTPGQGTTFRLCLGLERAEWPATLAPLTLSAPPRPTALPLHGVRLLLVDDSQMNLEVTAALLQAAGATVATADDGQAALDWLDRHSHDVDLVLMDVHMPVLDGLSATRRIRANPDWTTLPVVAMTAGATKSDQERAFEAGMNGYLLKPYQPDELMQTVRGQVLAYRGHLPTAPVVQPPIASPADHAWSAIEGFDMQAAKHRMGGDWSLFLRQCRRFECEFGALNVHDTLSRWQHDPKAVLDLLHKLKGNAGTLGATQVHHTAQRTHDCAKQNPSIAQLRHALEHLINDVTLMRQHLHHAVRTDTAPAPCTPAPTAAPALDNALYADWLTALANHDFAAISTFNRLKPALLGLLDPDQVAELEDELNNLSFDKVQARLQRISVN